MSPFSSSRRWLVCLTLILTGTASAADDWQFVQPGSIVLFRHALAPGGGDPPGFKLNECSTQRNLSDEGRAQARRIGQAFSERRIPVGAVWSSQWCRTRETADLAFAGLRRVDDPLFNSFFGQPEASTAQTQLAQARLARWQGPGVLVVVTHQVNITALTGVVPVSGEGVVVEPMGSGIRVRGRVAP